VSIENELLKQILKENSDYLDSEKLNILARVLPNMVIQVKKDKVPNYVSQNHKKKKETGDKHKMKEKNDYKIVNKIVVEVSEAGQCQWQLSTFCRIISLTESDLKDFEIEKSFDLMEVDFFVSEAHKKSFAKVMKKIAHWLSVPISGTAKMIADEMIMSESKLLATELINAELRILDSFNKYLDNL